MKDCELDYYIRGNDDLSNVEYVATTLSTGETLDCYIRGND